MQTYQFQDENNNTIQFKADKPPTEEELDALFAKHHPAYQERDSALAYSVDQAQKMYGGALENVGRLIDSPDLQTYGQNVQAQQDKDIAEGGYQSKYSTFEDSYAKEGLMGGLKWAIEGIQENAASSGASLVGAGAVGLAAYAGMPAWVVAGLGGLTGVNNVALNTGENVLEQKEKLGDFNESKATGAGLLAGFLDTYGAKLAISRKNLSKMSVKDIEQNLIQQGKPNLAKEFVRRMGAEGITEAAQEGVVMGTVESEGGTYTADEVRQRLTDSFLLGGAMSGTVNASIETSKAASNLVRGSSNKPATEEEIQAKASFAKLIAETAEQEGFNLKNIDRTSTTGARATIDLLHTRLTDDLNGYAKDLNNVLKETKQDSLEEIEVKRRAKSAFREAKTKTKSKVGTQEFASFKELAGDFYEGQQAINTMLMLNELTELHNNGYKSGITKFTDQFQLFGMGGEGYDSGRSASEKLLRPILSLGTGVATGGASLIPQVAVFGGGRMINRLGGNRNRSTLAKYVRENAKGKGLDPGDQSMSFRTVQKNTEEQRQADELKRTEEDLNIRRRQADQNLPVNSTSPLGVLQSVLGVSVNEIIDLSNTLRNDPNMESEIQRSADSLIRSRIENLKKKEQPNLTVLTPELKKMINPNPAFWRLKSQQEFQGSVNSAQDNVARNTENYNRGIEANRQFAQRLMQALMADDSVTMSNKEKITESLDLVLTSTITNNPIARLESEIMRLQKSGVPYSVIDKYFIPYVSRVKDQQANRQSLNQAQADLMTVSGALSMEDGPLSN